MNEGDVTSPRWVGGANTPESTGGDYQKLVADTRALGAEGYMRTDGRASVPYGFLYRLAAAVESLRAERDALRAQLDGMTTQWAVQDTLLTFIYEQENEEYARSLMASRRTERSRLVKRLVGPWAAVEDAEGVSDAQQ